MDEEEQKPAGWGEFPPKQEITIVPPKKLKSGETYQDKNKYWQSQGQAPIYKTNEVKADPTGSWVVYGGGKVVKFKTHGGAKAYAEKTGGKVASSEFYADKIQKQGVAEGHADQQRRVFKKNGEPVGEVGIDRESSPGVGQWYMKCYARNIDNAGYDSYEEAVEELKHCLKQGVAEATPRHFGPKRAGT